MDQSGRCCVHRMKAVENTINYHSTNDLCQMEIENSLKQNLCFKILTPPRPQFYAQTAALFCMK